MRLGPHPNRDAIVGPGGSYLAWRWDEWFFHLGAVIRELTTGNTSVPLVTTATEPDEITDRLLIYADGTDLKVKYPDGSTATITVTP
jgi:hypothetical protein